MASPQKTKKLAKKYVSKPADMTHKYYEPERLIQQWVSEGKSQEEIRDLLLKYIQDEKTKCLNDVVYFAETYGFIIGHGASGIIPFKPDEYQKELFKGQRQQKYLIVNKSRQLGVSTTTVFFSLWFSIFSSGKRTLIVANRRESAEEFITKFKTAYELLPEWLKPACTLYSKNVVEFDTKSVVRAMTSNPQAARAFSATLFVLDEAAFINDADAVVTAILPTISASDGKLFALSTPNGNSDKNWFYKTFTYAKRGLNQWKWYEFPWTVSSVFTKNPNFKADQIRLDNGNTDKFSQEYECFPPTTCVLTPYGIKPIEDVKVNDFVISHSGRSRKITAVMSKHYSGKLYKISSYGSSEDILCTPEHPIRTFNTTTKSYLWTTASNLTKDSLVVFPKMTLGDFKPLSSELCKLMAWYITEGGISKNQVTFSLSNEETEKNHVLALVSKLGLSYSIRQTTGWQIHVNNTKLSDFFAASCGSLAENKRIPFELISGQEVDFFNELMLGDGCLSVTNGCSKLVYTTISKSLAYQVQLLANSLPGKMAAGITKKASHQTTIEGRLVNCSDQYIVQIGILNPIAKSVKLIRDKNSIAAKIKSITTVDYDGPVHNLSVAYDESYIVAGRSVHNCNFNVNLNSVFKAEILREFNTEEKILNKGLGGITYDDTFFVWKMSEPEEEYIIGVDCASNKSHTKDYSCFEVLNKNTHEQVAEYIGKLPTELFAEILLKAARHYNNAQLVIEDNSYADALFWIIEQKGYNNLWYSPDKKTPGFSTNKSSRILLIEKLIVFYNNMSGIKQLRSPRLKMQMENFGGGKLYSNGSAKIEALSGNDDACMALALAVYPLSSTKYTGDVLNSGTNLLIDAKDIHQADRYSDAYIEYYAEKMGVTEKSLRHKLKLYHEIRNGVYEGTALDDIVMEHPIEEYERVAAQADFLGVAVPIMTTSSDDFFELNKKGIKTIDDIFDPELGIMLNAHRALFRY